MPTDNIYYIEAYTHVINLSVALAQPSASGQRELEEALDYAARREVIVVAAAGNQGAIGSSAGPRQTTVVPPLMDAWAAYQISLKA